MSGGPKGLSVYVDVNFFDHPKVVEAGEKAVVLYLQALCLAKRTWSDGFVSDAQIKRFGLSGVAARAKALEVAGLLRRDDERSGWWIHDFLDHNRSRAEHEAIVEKRRKAGSKGGRPPKANEKQVANQGGKQHEKQAGNPEMNRSEVKGSEKKTTTTRGSTQDPPDPSRRGGGSEASPPAETPAQAVVAQALAALGLVDPEPPTLGEIRTVERALGRGHPAEDLVAHAWRAQDRATGPDVRAWLGGVWTNLSQQDPTVRTPDGRSIRRSNPDRVDEILANVERYRAGELQ